MGNEISQDEAQDALMWLAEALDPDLDQVWCTILPYVEEEDRYLAPDEYEDERSRRIAERVDALQHARLELREVVNEEVT